MLYFFATVLISEQRIIQGIWTKKYSPLGNRKGETVLLQGLLFKKIDLKAFSDLSKVQVMENSKDMKHNSLWTFKYKSCYMESGNLPSHLYSLVPQKDIWNPQPGFAW